MHKEEMYITNKTNLSALFVILRVASHNVQKVGRIQGRRSHRIIGGDIKEEWESGDPSGVQGRSCSFL